MPRYLVFPRMHVTRANFQPAWWVIAPPGPMAALGFAHSLARALGTRELGVAIVHHDARLLAEDTGAYLLAPQQHRAASYTYDAGGAKGSTDYASNAALDLSLQPVVEGNVVVSLVVAIPDDAFYREADIEQFMARARYGGGIVEPGTRFRTEKSQADVMRRLRSGFSVHDRTDLMLAAVAQGITPAEAFLSLTSAAARADNPWLIPANLGYLALTPIEERRGSRGGYPHAFVEPLVGLTQYRPVRDGLPYWQYRHPENNLFLTTTTQEL